MSVGLHTTLYEFHSFLKQYGIRIITHQTLYTTLQPIILAMWNLPHIWSISNNSNKANNITIRDDIITYL